MSAPAAHAAVVHSGCGFYTIAQVTVTGGQDTFTGVAYGYAVFDDQGTHTLRCYVMVDGSEQFSTPTQSGTVFVAIVGPVTYTAADGQAVDLCTEIDGVTVACGPADTTTFPPPQVIEALDTVFALLCAVRGPEIWPFVDCPPYVWPFPFPPGIGEPIDAIVCPILAGAAPGIPGVIDISPEGDVTLVGVGPFWDCPPYDGLSGS